MPVIRVRENESFDGAMRRFKRSVEKSGIITLARRRQFFEKPCAIRKRNKIAAVKRQLKRLMKENSMSMPQRNKAKEPLHRGGRMGGPGGAGRSGRSGPGGPGAAGRPSPYSHQNHRSPA